MLTNRLNGIAHITGGGLTENLPRIIPPKKNLKFTIEKGSWPVNSIFNIIQSMGSVTDSEMYKTFNMGIGLVVVVNKTEAKKILSKLKRLGEKAYIIGRIEKGHKEVEYI